MKRVLGKGFLVSQFIFLFALLALPFGVIAKEVPISPYYPLSNEDWWQYQFDGEGYQREHTTSDDETHEAYSNANCGPACAAMVINYLRNRGVTTTYHDVISSDYPDVHCYARWNYCQGNGHSDGYKNTDWSVPGATKDQIQNALLSEGFESHFLTGYDCLNDGTGIANLQNAINQGKICICLVAPKYYRDDVEKYFSHWTVVYGYDDNSVYLNDPGYRTGQGFKASKSDFGDAIWKVTELSTIVVIDTTFGPPSGRVTLNLDTKYWEYGSYQLRIIVQASPGEVSSITISGPCIDTVTYSYSGGEQIFVLGTKEPPRIGQSITFYIKYQDDSSETISKTIDGVFTETPVLVSPPDGSTVNTLTPTFEWCNLSISGLIYSVQIDDTSHNRVYDVYDLPGGTTSHTIQKPLTRGATYLWLVSASDSNGNEALADWDKLRISSVAGLGYDKVTQVIDTINQGAEAVFNYIISQTKDLIFALDWEGSALRLSVYRPDGSLYAEGESSTSPVTISIPKAEAADWRYKITGIDVPYDDYPFVVEIGERSPVASDLENIIIYPNPCRLTNGNATITFKGLTVDATIRILSIDGQLINETELIGQVNWTWNVKNQANEDLSRGIYIYLITNSAGEKKIGKIAIIN